MKIKLTDPVLDYENKPIEVPPDNKVLTYFDVFVNSLNGTMPGEILTAEKKHKIYQITKKIYQYKEVNLTNDQLAIIKERVGKTYAPVVYGRIVELIDGVEITDPEKVDAKELNAPETPKSDPAVN